MSFEETAKSVDKLNTSVTSSAAMNAVDLLGKAEIEMLRELGEMRFDAATSEYIDSIAADPASKGRYIQLSELGFIYGAEYSGGNLGFHGVSPKAGWAIARYEAEEAKRADEEAKEKKDRIFDKLFNVGMLVLGWVLGIISTLITAHMIA